MPKKGTFSETQMKVFISAAEPSGDRIAAALMTEWKKMHPVEFVGISGPLMRKVGLKSIYGHGNC